MNKPVIQGFHASLVGTLAVGAATTTNGVPSINLAGLTYLTVLAKFVYGSSGGTAVKVYIQTSLDGGTTWIDIMSFTFATTTASKVSSISTGIALVAAGTPSDGSLSDNTILNGLLGDRIRAKVVSTGTYAGTATVDVLAYGKA